MLSTIFSAAGTSRFDADNLLLVISAGESEDARSRSASIDLAETLRATTGTRVLSVGIGNFDTEELSGITSYGQREDEVSTF